MKKVRYIGPDPALQGATASACDNMPEWFINLDRYPGGPLKEQSNPIDQPLCFGRHFFLPTDWEVIEDVEGSCRLDSESCAATRRFIKGE